MFFSYYEVLSRFARLHRSAVILCVSCYLVIMVFSYWRLFYKAGLSPFLSLVPFLNEYKMFRLVWGDGYFFIFELVPFVGFVFHWIMLYKLCLAYGRDSKRWIAAMFVVPLITRLVMAMDKSAYIGPEGRPETENPYLAR